MTNNTFKFTKKDIAAAVERGITPDTLAQQFADLLNEVVAENSKNAKKKEKIADMQLILDAVVDFINKWYKTEDNAKFIEKLISVLTDDAEGLVEVIDNEIAPYAKAFDIIFNTPAPTGKPNGENSLGINYTNPKITTANTKEKIPFKITFKDPEVATSTAKISNDEIIDNFLTSFGLK